MLSDPRVLYGIDCIAVRSRADGLPIGILKVVSQAQLPLSAEPQKLYAGSNPYPWASEAGQVDTELSFKVKALPNFLFEIFLGASVTAASTDTAGTISTATNKKGTSVISNVGLAAISIKSAVKANLKFGKYVIRAATATTLEIFMLSDIDANRGVPVKYLNDSLKLDLPTITIVQATDTDIDALGIALEGGAGVIGMTVGDTAEFEVLPPSSESSIIIVGQQNAVMPEFAATLYSQKRATGEMFEVDVPRAQGSGMPLNMNEKAWSEADLNMALLYDSAVGYVYKARHIKPA